MNRKWYKGIFGVEVADMSAEFAPKHYRCKAYDLGRFGMPTVPVIGQVSYRRLSEPSPWHVHRGCLEILCCTAGACTYESEGKSYRLSAGKVFVSRADEPHRQLDCPKGYAMSYLQFRPAASRQSQWFRDAFARIERLFECNRSVPARFGRIISLAEGGRSGIELRIRLQTEVQALLLDVLDSASVARNVSVPDQFGTIARRMRQNPEADYPVDGLAAEAGLSKASFMAQFKAAHGHSPHAYLLSCRVAASKKLLEQGLPVEAVAPRVGFRTPQHLARTFRNFVGMSPKKWLQAAKVARRA